MIEACLPFRMLVAVISLSRRRSVTFAQDAQESTSLQTTLITLAAACRHSMMLCLNLERHGIGFQHVATSVYNAGGMLTLYSDDTCLSTCLQARGTK